MRLFDFKTSAHKPTIHYILMAAFGLLVVTILAAPNAYSEEKSCAAVVEAKIFAFPQIGEGHQAIFGKEAADILKREREEAERAAAEEARERASIDPHAEDVFRLEIRNMRALREAIENPKFERLTKNDVYMQWEIMDFVDRLESPAPLSFLVSAELKKEAREEAKFTKRAFLDARYRTKLLEHRLPLYHPEHVEIKNPLPRELRNRIEGVTEALLKPENVIDVTELANYVSAIRTALTPIFGRTVDFDMEPVERMVTTISWKVLSSRALKGKTEEQIQAEAPQYTRLSNILVILRTEKTPGTLIHGDRE